VRVPAASRAPRVARSRSARAGGLAPPRAHSRGCTRLSASTAAANSRLLSRARACGRRLTEGYSGSDLKHLCTTAALSPIRELLAAAGPAALERGATPLSADALRPLSHADFERARAVTKPSVSQQLDVTRELNKWHRTFAEGAGAQPVGNDALGF
jgi:hypothetical protein